MQKIARAIILVLAAATATLAVTLALPADAAPNTGGGYSSNGTWSPYGANQGSPQNDGAGGN
jgi:hypothetical protein